MHKTSKIEAFNAFFEKPDSKRLGIHCSTMNSENREQQKSTPVAVY